MDFHEEKIVCPNCRTVQIAKVEHTAPWYSYIHTCEKCGYTIMESEWEQETQMENNVIYNEPDPMNPLCDIWTFKGADRWYFTREEAEKAYNELKDFRPKTTEI